MTARPRRSPGGRHPRNPHGREACPRLRILPEIGAVRGDPDRAPARPRPRQNLSHTPAPGRGSSVVARSRRRLPGSAACRAGRPDRASAHPRPAGPGRAAYRRGCAVWGRCSALAALAFERGARNAGPHRGVSKWTMRAISMPHDRRGGGCRRLAREPPAGLQSSPAAQSTGQGALSGVHRLQLIDSPVRLVASGPRRGSHCPVSVHLGLEAHLGHHARGEAPKCAPRLEESPPRAPPVSLARISLLTKLAPRGGELLARMTLPGPAPALPEFASTKGG
jgi:hypothetical protein